MFLLNVPDLCDKLINKCDASNSELVSGMHSRNY